MTEEKISELKNKSIEITQSEQGEEKSERMNNTK